MAIASKNKASVTIKQKNKQKLQENPNEGLSESGGFSTLPTCAMKENDCLPLAVISAEMPAVADDR